MAAPGNPASSRSRRDSMESQARSPESSLIPAISCPFSRSHFAASMAFFTPSSVSYVSTRKTQLFGIAFAYERNDSSSSSKDITQLWACVPLTGIP